MDDKVRAKWLFSEYSFLSCLYPTTMSLYKGGQRPPNPTIEPANPPTIDGDDLPDSPRRIGPKAEYDDNLGFLSINRYSS